MEKLKKYPLFNKWTLVIVLFSFMQGLCLIHHGDDLYWFQGSSYNNIFSSNSDNSRYFTNIITYLISSNSLCRIIIYTIFLSSLFIIIAKIVNGTHLKSFFGYSFSFISFLLIPCPYYANVFNWMSGFTNYVISMVFIFLYLWFVYPILNGRDPKYSKWFAIYTFLLGFLGSFCVEHVSIYNFIFGLFIILYSYKIYKKVFLPNITYIISVIIALILMFSNSTYSGVLADDPTRSDLRSFEFSFSDLSMKLYTEIIPLFAKKFWFIHLLIAFSLYIIYSKLDKSSFSKEKNRYSNISMILVVLYAVYSLFSSFFTDYQSLTYAYRVNALETAFVFLYILSIIYLSYILFDKYRFIRISIFMISTIFLTAPFIIVNPVSYRCFFAEYCFWILAAGEILVYVFTELKVIDLFHFKRLLSIICVCMFFSISYINVSNKICEYLRVKYIHQQIGNNSNVIEIIEIPYVEYCSDVIILFPKNNDESEIFETDIANAKYKYFEYYKDYIGVDDRFDPKKFVYISIQDYFMNH